MPVPDASGPDRFSHGRGTTFTDGFGAMRRTIIGKEPKVALQFVAGWVRSAADLEVVKKALVKACAL